MNPRLASFALASLALGLLPWGGARAQQPAPASGPYRLGPDDTLSIQVLNFPELDVPQVVVPSDGKVTVPLLGSVPVSGMTTAAVTRYLTRRWGQYDRNPLVTVTLTQRRRESVQVNGLVTHVGPVPYQPALRLTQALAEAGGALDTGDLSQVTVTHKNGASQTVDESSPHAGGTAQDPILAPDDAVYVPAAHIQVSVLGEVAKPGSYAYKPKMTVMDALGDADNVTLATADLSHATLLHDGTERPLDLNALLTQGQLADDVALAPGDRIFIPPLHNRIYIDGAVGHPGYYAFKPGDRLVDAIGGSGGLVTGYADMMKVSVIHVDKLHQTATQQTVDVGKFYQKGDMQADVLLQPGDAIYVPIKGGHNNPIEALGSIIGIGTGVRVLGGR